MKRLGLHALHAPMLDLLDLLDLSARALPRSPRVMCVLDAPAGTGKNSGVNADDDETLSPDKVQVLVANHSRFLAFLKPRVGSVETAEEILQAAFVKGLEKQDAIRDDENAVRWFFRLLRNALVDHYRHRGVELRGRERYAQETPESAPALEAAIEGEVCACVGTLIPTLKAEYAEVLRRVELEGRPVVQVAAELGLTPNNAAVRLHRAREALKKRLVQTCGTCTEHGCLECTCGPEPR
jgi:RNA polymerase sigma factor (sigma-70 family)